MFVLFGIWAETNGRHFWLNRLHQPVYPASAIALGLVLLACVLIPWSLLDRVAKWLSNPRGREDRPRMRN
jgi:lauroyl/myristoyl acyltransferase